MNTVQFAQRFHLFWGLLHNPQFNSLGSSNANLTAVSTFSEFRNVFMRHKLSYSVKACDSGASVNICNGNTNTPSNLQRSYQVVVAATREMGIGMDGKLPWNLPSDLRFFKDLTTSTSDDSKRNAVIMGRRTWDSIPLKYRPLPGRLNVVLTRAGKLESPPSFENLLVCNDLSGALKLLAEPPHSVSIEKVFVIGGGQILREALNGPNCEAIHLTDINASIKCDTFVPRIDSSLFCPLISSTPMEENDIQFSFVTYVRSSNSAEEPYGSQIDTCNFDTETARIEGSSLKKLAEFDYLKQIQENIACGKHNLIKQ